MFVGLAAAAWEGTDAWEDFLAGLLQRGLRPPLLVISDGAPGIIAACELVLGRSLRQRCLIHKSRNVLSKISKADQQAVKDDLWKVFDTTVPELNDIAPGQQLVEAVQQRIDAFAAAWEKQYPAAIKSMMTDRQSLTPYLRFFIEHHKRIRHSNFIERTFGETRRRVKVIGRFPGETSCVSLVWAVLDRAARGFTMTAVALRTPHDLRRGLLDPLTQLRPTTTATVTATADAA